MKLKTITTVALIGSVYLTVINIMADIGIFGKLANIVKIGWLNEYGESHMVSIDSTKFILNIPYYICFYIFYTAFVWKIRNFADKRIGNIAFGTWCLSLIFTITGVLTNAYLAFHFSGETIMPESYWEEHERIVYFMFFSLQNSHWFTVRMIVELLSCLALIIVFISLRKKDKTISIVGIIAMIANIFSFMPLPYLYLICHLGWIMLFAIILWEIQKESTLINSAS